MAHQFSFRAWETPMSRLTHARSPGDLTERRPAGRTSTGIGTQVGRIAFALILICAVSACFAQDRTTSKTFDKRPPAPSFPEASAMKIRLTLNGKPTTATLIDTPTTRDFVALLPMTLTLEDYASTERIAYLPKKLSTVGAPRGVDPDVGDITYYAPWGNLAIFYRDSGYATGLIKLGSLDAGIDALDARGSLKVTIETIAQ